MTGFGSARGQMDDSRLFVEVRSVNHRYLEVNQRFPHRLSSLEGDVSRQVRSRFARGKFDLFVKETSRDHHEVVLAKESFALLQQIRKTLKIKQEISISDLLAFREIYGTRHSQDNLDQLKGPLLRLTLQALARLDQMRGREGVRLQRWFRQRLKHLERLLGRIESQVRGVLRHNQRRLESRRKDQAAEGDLVQEMGAMTDRMDVTEEIVRLRSHLREFMRILNTGGPVGRKLDFLAQEIGREINTIGSKSQGVKLSHQVVDFKSELEKIREQVQNIE